jgi:hypothetical protein
VGDHPGTRPGCRAREYVARHSRAIVI